MLLVASAYGVKLMSILCLKIKVICVKDKIIDVDVKIFFVVKK